MTKAIFSERQPLVTKQGDYFQIALNEKEVKNSINHEFDDEDGQLQTMYEYDFHEFKDSNLTIDEVRANIEKYSHYTPGPITENDKNVDLEKSLEEMKQILQEIIMMSADVDEKDGE